MGQLVVTLLSAMILLTVPLGILQVHTVMQMRSELLDVSLATTKFLSNHGSRSDSDAQMDVTQFIQQEVANKPYKLEANKIMIEVSRTKAAEPNLWSHEDEFRLRVGIPYPRITTLFQYEQQPIFIERTGTINVMNYDL